MTTPYRDDTDSLEARHAALAEELSSVQARTKELDELRASEARLEKEVADVQRKLEGRRSRRALPLLESIKIASPCSASWDEMIGDDRARFCTHCQKDVFNLSAMPRDEAETFMRERTTDVCVQLHKRADGTVITSDCPVGVKRKRRRKVVAAAVGSGLLAAGALVMAARQQQVHAFTGAVAMPPDEPAHMIPEEPQTPVVDKAPERPLMPMGVVPMPLKGTRTLPKKVTPAPGKPVVPSRAR